MSLVYVFFSPPLGFRVGLAGTIVRVVHRGLPQAPTTRAIVATGNGYNMKRHSASGTSSFQFAPGTRAPATFLSSILISMIQLTRN